MAACVSEVACSQNYPLEDCLDDCQATWDLLQGKGQTCTDAYAALNACLAALDCDGWAGYKNSGDPPYPCSDEDALVKSSC